ncbi:LolA family protein [Candidatus Endolissoclinum faulkneri]|uniref:LolA family protein n=1 Tax=Candidatus Endolissoclinum faulkneri TaxID=1263979 RepID=UPI001D05A281|nr:outer membrane lipoprotein carrier protein LolA [Candidatus Endolissoclinum faulkneri]
MTRTAASALGETMTAKQTQEIKRIENYFNQLTTMHSDFLQINSSGSIARGVVWIERPGKMRLEYDPPSPVLITSDGGWVNYQDNELKQSTQIPLISSPLSVLLSKYISFADDLVIEDVHKSCNMISLQLYQRGDSGQVKIIFAFQANPLLLKQWSIIDNNGSEIRIVLLNPVFGISLPSKLWLPKDFGQKFGRPED